MPFLGTEISRGGVAGGGAVNTALFKASEEINMSARYCHEEGLLSLKETRTLQHKQNGKPSAALL